MVEYGYLNPQSGFLTTSWSLFAYVTEIALALCARNLRATSRLKAQLNVRATLLSQRLGLYNTYKMNYIST